MEKNSVLFRFRAFDTQSALPGEVLTSKRYFAECGTATSDRVTKQTEAQIVEFLLRLSHVREFFFQHSQTLGRAAVVFFL